MAGTKIGGLKAKEKNLARDPDFYRKMGRKGGKNGNTGGFASLAIGDDGLTGPERAKVAGARGGRVSRKSPVVALEAIEIENVVHDNIKIAVAAADNKPANIEVRRTNKRSMFANIRRMFS